MNMSLLANQILNQASSKTQVQAPQAQNVLPHEDLKKLAAAVQEVLITQAGIPAEAFQKIEGKRPLLSVKPQETWAKEASGWVLKSWTNTIILQDAGREVTTKSNKKFWTDGAQYVLGFGKKNQDGSVGFNALWFDQGRVDMLERHLVIVAKLLEIARGAEKPSAQQSSYSPEHEG